MAEMRAGLRLARTLAGEHAADEPAARLYALIICRRAFPRRWSNMALALTRTHAAIEALWARARASEEGYVAVRAFEPDDLDDDP